MVYDYPRDAAVSWLKRHGLLSSLTIRENKILKSSDDYWKKRILLEAESLWAFAWVFEMVPVLDFSVECTDELASFMPQIWENDSMEKFVQRCKFRDKDEIIQYEDLAYCLHWATKNAILNKAKLPSNFPGYQVYEKRRQTLSWILSDDDWDDVDIST